MKIILLSSVVAMASAGIFGSADLIKDLKNGTMIEYDRTDAGNVSRTSHKPIGVEKTISPITELVNASEGTTALSDLKFDDFSRGEPISIEEEVVEPIALVADKPQSSEPAVTVDFVSPISTPKEKPVESKVGDETSSATTKPTERKISLKYFSRSRMSDVSEILSDTDSLKKE